MDGKQKKRNKDYDFSPLLYVGGTQKNATQIMIFLPIICGRKTIFLKNATQIMIFLPHYMWAENKKKTQQRL